MNGGNNSATPSQSRPTKRARTTKTAAQAARPNTRSQTTNQAQAQQTQPATADPINGHSPNLSINQAQGPINPNEGAFEPTPEANNINPGSVQQTRQTNPNPNVNDFGLNDQANVDSNHGGFIQNSQPDDLVNNNLIPNQIDGANNPSLDAAVTQNHGFEVPQFESDLSSLWTGFSSSNFMNGLDFDFSLNSLPQGDSSKDQQTIQQNQPAQEQHVQQQSAEGENADQVSNNDDLFGDIDYEQFAAGLGPLARFNAEN